MGNLNVTWVESSGYGLRDTPGNGLQMVGDAFSSLPGVVVVPLGGRVACLKKLPGYPLL